MLLISSLQNPRVKQTIRLRDRKGRRATGQCVIDGARELRRALECGFDVETVFVCPGHCHSADADAVLRLAEQRGIERVEITPPVFEKMAYGEREEGVIGIGTIPTPALDDLTLPADALVAVLEGVEKPGNLGAVLRSADAAGVSALVLSGQGGDAYNPNTIRASLGTLFAVPPVTAEAAQARDWLIARGLQIVAARVDADRLYTEVDFRRPTAIVLGNEAEGLSDIWQGPHTTAVRLPMRGLADSLNVSATAAILFYEALRQRS